MASKEEKADVPAKKLIANFEKGEISQNDNFVESEKPIAKPGAAKKLQQVYEEKSKPEPDVILNKASPGVRKTAAPQTNNSIRHDSSAGPKNILVVFAHWEKKSFNGALLETTVKSLEKAGHKVTVSDLYSMKWNPCPSKEDIIGGPRNKDVFNYLDETTHALQNGTLAKDIVEEHRKMKEADLIIFQFPINWYGFPAIMKGWFDRCITNGFAFNTEQGQLFDTGLMKGKKAMLSFTTGGKDTAYSNSGINGDINVILWPMQLLLRFVGFDVLAPQISYNVFHSDADSRKQCLDTWEMRMSNIFRERCLKFVSLSDFNMEKGLVLTEGSESVKHAKPGFGITVGQNLGKPYIPNSMTQAD